MRLGWDGRYIDLKDTYIAGNSPGDCSFNLYIKFENDTSYVVSQGKYCAMTLILTVPLGPADFLGMNFTFENPYSGELATIESTWNLTTWNVKPHPPFYTWFEGPRFHLGQNNVPSWGKDYYMQALNIDFSEMWVEDIPATDLELTSLTIHSPGAKKPCSTLLHGLFGSKICEVDECGVCNGDGSTCAQVSSAFLIIVPTAFLIVVVAGTLIAIYMHKNNKFGGIINWFKKDTSERIELVQNASLEAIKGFEKATKTIAKFDWMIKRNEIVFGEEMGKGSSGTVFSGEWRGQKVAIKELAVDVHDRHRTLTEVKLAMGLRPHKNVIQILGVCVTKENIYIVMNKMYTSLDQIVYNEKKHAKMTTNDIYQFASGICAGMIHLSNEGICHRDLAARNICLSKEQVPTITDFGLSRKLVSACTGVTNTQMGPVAWMAPENFHQRYSTKSDVWSFGCVLYEMVKGKPPHHQNKDLFSLALKIRDEHIAPDIPENCDPGLAEIMRLCWQVNPKDRPTFQEISTMLKNRMSTNEVNNNLKQIHGTSQGYVSGFPQNGGEATP